DEVASLRSREPEAETLHQKSKLFERDVGGRAACLFKQLLAFRHAPPLADDDGTASGTSSASPLNTWRIERRPRKFMLTRDLNEAGYSRSTPTSVRAYLLKYLPRAGPTTSPPS